MKPLPLFKDQEKLAQEFRDKKYSDDPNNKFTTVLKEMENGGVTPYFYDSYKIWWLWDKNDFCWKMCDEVDILNMYSKDTGAEIIKSRIRQETLNKLKQEGRKKKPKEAPKSWIQFKSDIVDISNGNKFAATPEYFITNPLPYKLGASKVTPTIDKLFREWVVCEGIQDESYVNTLYEIVAYSCIQEQFLQMIIALTGSGSNGKGTFLNLIGKFIGQNNICSSNLRTLTTRNFEASALYKKLVCFFGEVDSYDLTNTNLIKSLTGEDLIRYEFKGKTPFSEHSPTTPIIASNSLPITPDKSIGFYRRWHIVDFPNQFEVKRNLLAEIPEEEFENLGNKIVDILKFLYEKNEFTNAGTVDERILRYERRSHPLITFIDEVCEEGEGMIKLRSFANKFNQYLKKKRLRPYTVNKIGKMLRDEGYEIGARYFGKEKTDSAKAVINLFFIDIKEKIRQGNKQEATEKGSLSSSNNNGELPKLPISLIEQKNTVPKTFQEELAND